MTINKPISFWQPVVVLVLLIFGSFYLLGRTAAGTQAPKLSGDLWVRGPVTVNGVAANSGTTVLSGSRLKTAVQGAATINLNRLGRIRLEPETEMVLSVSGDLIGGELLTGQAVVTASSGVGISVVTAAGVIAAEPKQAAALQVAVTPEATSVGATRGAAKITAGNKVEHVAAGEEVIINKAPGQGTLRRRLALAGIGAGAAAGTLGALAGESVASMIASVSGTPNVTKSEATAGNLTNTVSQPSPTPTPARPVTPVKPPPTVEVCGCRFNANTGQVIDSDSRTRICHVAGNGQRNTLILACSALGGHFNLNGTPRAGHLDDTCGVCP